MLAPLPLRRLNVGGRTPNVDRRASTRHSRPPFLPVKASERVCPVEPEMIKTTAQRATTGGGITEVFRCRRCRRYDDVGEALDRRRSVGVDCGRDNAV